MVNLKEEKNVFVLNLLYINNCMSKETYVFLSASWNPGVFWFYCCQS